MCKIRRLTLEGRENIFKSLSISKIIHLATTISISVEIIDFSNKIQKSFLWKNSKPKIKHEILCKSYKHRGLKNVNIFEETISLQYWWLLRLFDHNFHDWKVIQLESNTIIKKNLHKNFKFHSNLQIKKSLVNDFLNFFQKWSRFLSDSITVTSTMTQFLWFNKYIMIDTNNIFFPNILYKVIN